MWKILILILLITSCSPNLYEVKYQINNTEHSYTYTSSKQSKIIVKSNKLKINKDEVGTVPNKSTFIIISHKKL